MLLPIIFSSIILVLSFLLTLVNWKILQVSIVLREISGMVLSETIVIKEETIRLRKISERVLEETTKVKNSLELEDNEKEHEE